MSPFPHLDLTPFAFTVTGLAVAGGVFRFHLLDIVPVARDAIIEGMNDVVIVLDTQNRIVDLNPAAERLIGHTASEAIGQPAAEALSGWPDLVEYYCGLIEAGAEIVLAEGDSQRYFDPCISPLLNRHGRLTGRLIVLRDITERKRAKEALQKAHEELEQRVKERTSELHATNESLRREISARKRMEEQLVHLANCDPLTDLVNRHRFQEELEHQLEQARRYGAHGALLFLDLDQFKYVNDSLGHWAGDEFLRSLASLLRERLRDTDLLARLGGDEFAILLSQTDVDQAQAVAEHILEEVRHHTVVIGGQRIGVTISIGIALFPEHGITMKELLVNADLAMYQVKENGGDGFCVYTPNTDWQVQIESRLTWEQCIREALEKDRFLLYLQPILDLRNNQVSQYELLLRMASDGGKVVLPGNFLGVAERFGLIHDIDRWVVRQGIHLIADHYQAGQKLCLGVNLSGKAFADSELLALIEQELTAAAINPPCLVLEITESAAIADITQAQKFVDTLKGLGCRFALDDFGMGFSSFYHLKHLPMDYLKIDGGFIRDLPRNPVDQHLVKAMVEVARALGKQTIAEFVSDEETVRLLREYGADYAQGYYLGQPRPVSEIFPREVELFDWTPFEPAEAQAVSLDNSVSDSLTTTRNSVSGSASRSA